MKNSTLKNLALLVSFTTLIWNTSPVFGQVIEIDVLGGGYKLLGPATINFQDVASSKSVTPSTLYFSGLGVTTPSEASHNYLEVVDENGGNPFDVTVSSDVFKRSELLETDTTMGSTTTSLTVDSSIGFFVGDSINLVGSGEGTHTISSIPDSHTLTLSDALSIAPDPGTTVRRIVDCAVNSKKCIPLEDFSIANGESTHTVTVVNGNSNDFTLNSQTTNQKPFGGRTTTTLGSTDSTLKVVDSSVFDVGDILTFDDNAISPSPVTVAEINDANTITIQETFATPPEDNIAVYTSTSRTLTLGNGNGAEPGDFKIFPVLQVNVAPGQMPGTYQTVLNFTII